MKQKKGEIYKAKKRTWAGFCKFSFSQSPSKKRSSNYFYQKDTWHAQKNATKPCYKFAKMDPKTAKKLTKRQNKTSFAAKRALLAIYKNPKLTAQKAFSLKFRHSGLCKFRKLNTL